MLIERWMKFAVHTVKPLDSVAHARALLEEHRINQLPGRLVGIVTDRDLRDATRAGVTLHGACHQAAARFLKTNQATSLRNPEFYVSVGTQAPTGR